MVLLLVLEVFHISYMLPQMNTRTILFLQTYTKNFKQLTQLNFYNYFTLIINLQLLNTLYICCKYLVVYLVYYYKQDNVLLIPVEFFFSNQVLIMILNHMPKSEINNNYLAYLMIFMIIYTFNK